MHIGIIVFRLLKHCDELDKYKDTNSTGGHNTFMGGGARPPVPPPRWLRPCGARIVLHQHTISVPRAALTSQNRLLLHLSANTRTLKSVQRS